MTFALSFKEIEELQEKCRALDWENATLHTENQLLRVRITELEAQVGVLKEALKELAFAPVTFDDERLNYIELQVAKASLKAAQEALSQT